MSVIFPRIDPNATKNIKRMFDIWKTVGVSSDIDTLRFKITYLSRNIQAIGGIILDSSAESQNKIGVKMMECLL